MNAAHPGESPRSRRKISKAERRRQAWELRLRGLTQWEIARQLGVDQSTISLDLAKAFDAYQKVCDAEAVHFARQDLARVEALLSVWLPKALDGPEPNLQAAEFCRRMLERRSRLLGLDAAQKVEVSGNAEDLSPEALRQKLLAALGEIA